MHAGPSVSSAAHDAGRAWIGKGSVIGRTAQFRHVLITISLLGMSFVWSTEFAQAGPYLLNLGLSKSLTSLVFLAGPLAGLVVQPLIGTYADNCRLSIGRRRPFIIAGGAICVLSLIVFGFAKEIASVFTPQESSAHKTLSLVFAVLSIYSLDFSINAVQAMDRAIIVDIVPADEQEEVNAWAGRMGNLGSVIGFFVSGANLLRAFSWLASTQIKLISIFAIAAFISSHATMSFAVTERVLVQNDDSHKSSLASTVQEIWQTYQKLPANIWRVFQIQIFAWIGMFGIMFYSSTYIAEIYIRNNISDNVDLSDAPEAIVEAATRAGSNALLWQALLAFGTTVLLPFLVYGPKSQHNDRTVLNRYQETDELPPFLNRVAAIFHAQIKPILPQIPFPWLNLPLAWSIGLGLFGVLMFLTWFAQTVAVASALISLTGVTMGLAGWAPFSILGELILDDSKPAVKYPSYTNGHLPLPLSPIPEEEEEHTSELDYPRLRRSPVSSPTDSVFFAGQNTEDIKLLAQHPSRPRILQIRHSDSFDDSERSEVDNYMREERFKEIVGGTDGTADSAGTILGLHNVFVVLPQLLVTFISFIIFAILANGPSQNDAIGVIFRIGGASSCVAAWLCFKLSRADRFHYS